MNTLHVLTVGGFGAAVGKYLSEMIPGAVSEPAPYPPGSVLELPKARAYCLAAWRSVSELYPLMDAVAFDRSTPWVPVILEHPQLRVGPIVVPGEGPCSDCYSKRQLQHSPNPEVDIALERYYSVHADAGPEGFLPATALLAAGLVSDIVGDGLKIGENYCGSILRINVVTQRMTRGRLLGVHGCPRCGLGRDEETRSWLRLRHEMGSVLSWKG